MLSWEHTYESSGDSMPPISATPELPQQSTPRREKCPVTDTSRPIDTSQFDASTEPSSDFFRYANGGWLDANPVPPEYGSWGAFHEVTERNQELLHKLLQRAAQAAADPEAGADAATKMVGDYFAAAMDEAAIAEQGDSPLRPLLKRIDAVASVADARAVLGELHRVGVGALHGVYVAPDFDNADSYLVYVVQGGLGLPERDYYTRDDERSTVLRDAYTLHIANQLANLGYSASDAREAGERILALELQLAEPSYTAEQLRDVQLTTNRHDVAALNELMPGFGLAEHVRALGVTSETVNVDNPGFFSAVEGVLAETPAETLRDYLRWHLVRSYASALSPVFEEEAFGFYGRALGGQQQMRPRWKRVLEAAGSDIGELVAQLYVDAAFSEQAKQRCEEMVEHLLSAMGKAIRGAEWMTEPTKAEALAKLAGFSYKIGFPDEWRDYSALEIDRESYAANRMRSAAFEHDREMNRLGEPVDRAEWAMPAHSVNAYYHPLLNEIVFPAGILQPPFFYAEADDALNYGAIGAVIGHEITHGFDDRGSHFDAQGRLRDWWSQEDRAEFDRRAQVLVTQFDAYEVADDLNVNGRLTLGENIADLGGLKIAFEALREAGPSDEMVDGLTPAQRFFLSWATVWRTNYTAEYQRLLVNVDPHSPARFRVNGPLSNFPLFAEAFQIAKDTPMARGADERAHVW
jgi:putative endopeptidase